MRTMWTCDKFFNVSDSVLLCCFYVAGEKTLELFPDICIGGLKGTQLRKRDCLSELFLCHI